MPDLGNIAEANSGLLKWFEVGKASTYPQFQGNIFQAYQGRYYTYGGQIQAQNTYTGFIMTPTAGTMTGIVTVLGVKQS